MAKLGFLADFKKKAQKLDNVNLDFGPPTRWYDTGNLALNKILSGSFTKGIPQGRLTALAGPSGCLTADETVKSYIFRSNKVEPDVKREE